MRKRPFAIMALTILIFQALIITAGIQSATLNPVHGNEGTYIISQDPGTRLTGEELTDYVPVHINGTPEFAAQFWDGAGTDIDPFVISGLNITYDFPDFLIKITNTDAYFVIEDCYLGQLSQESGILFENVTHGVIRYVTIISDGEGAYFENADGSVLDHVYVDAGKYNGLYINHSPNFELKNSFIDSITSAAVRVNGSDYSIFRNTTMDSDIPYTDLYITHSDFVEAYDLEFHAAAIELYLQNCESFYADGLTSTEGEYGLYFYYCNDSVIMNADVTSDDKPVRIYECENITITDSAFSSPDGGSDCIDVDDSSHITFDNIFVNDTNNQGVNIATSDNVIIRNSMFSNIPGACIWFDSCNDSSVILNSFDNIADMTVAFTSASHRGNVSYNTVSDITGDGFYTANSDNGTISHNSISGATNYGIYSQLSYNWRIHDNVIDSVDVGIQLDQDSHTDVWNNDISMCGVGIWVTTHGMLELWENTISDCDNGMYLFGSDYQYVRDNSITFSEIGINLLFTVNSTFATNIISDCEETGIYLQSVTTTEFTGNNISRCVKDGFFFYSGSYLTFNDNRLEECGFNFLQEPSSIQKFNHSMSGNTVNGKPVYYALSQSGLSIDGHNYGQVILINCTYSVVSNGYFDSCTSAVQINYGHDIAVSGLYCENLWMPVYTQYAPNVTITDCEVFGNNEQNGIFAFGSDDVWIENCNFTGLGGDWLWDDCAIKIGDFDGFTIIDCDFTDISGYAIGASDGALISGFYGEVIGCTFTNASVGVYAYNAQYLNITNNVMQWCDYGILSELSDYWRVEWNEIHDNDIGIYKFISYDWLTANNTIRWNRIGIESDGSFTEGIVADNTIALNFEANGVDDNLRYWDDNIDTGNYWDDYSGSGVYYIPGGGGAQDRYPMQYMVYEPIVNSPQDFAFAEGSTGNEILWKPFDDSLRDWVVTVDSDTWDSGIWNFDNVTVNFDALPYGVHDVEITVWDVDLNTVSDTVTVTVYDDAPPEIDAPPNTEFYVDADGQTLEWLVEDLNPTTYTVFIGTMEYDSGTWISGTLVIDADDIGEGEHEVQVTIFDIDGNSASSNVTVLVTDDDDSPTIDSPEDVVYIEGTTGNIIQWSPEDDHPDYYEVSFNGSVTDTDSWGGSRIALNVDGLLPGVYEYEMTVFDVSGGSASDIVNVTVIPIILPDVPLTYDWLLLVLVGTAVGAAVIVVAIVYYMKKRTPSG